ncbi:MAG: chromate transporter [Synechococcus sp. SB0673_bin_10]|nr:chromate transporter [Synechococcus sp. SB0667_bin_8]MYG63608.1 chromate transporter [Synechococcus sp. SB0675_bin_7]MYI72122.1 chromate transporter [Synechococcus sp. SB0673_bin_10]MYK86475.1 chromate transporter [Synechococcus sp. SB0669_bin_7]
MPRRSRTYGREPSLLARADPGVLAHRAAGVWRPQAHMALMGDQVVQQRQWVSPQAFAEGLALPGPASKQLAMVLGWRCRGALGGG